MKRPKIKLLSITYEYPDSEWVAAYQNCSLIKIKSNWSSHYLLYKCNGINTMKVCKECKLRYECFTGKEAIITDRELYSTLTKEGLSQKQIIAGIKKYIFKEKEND